MLLKKLIEKIAGEPGLAERRAYEERMRQEAIHGSHHDRVQWRLQEQRHKKLCERLMQGDDCGLTPKAAAKYRRRIAEGDTSW